MTFTRGTRVFSLLCVFAADIWAEKQYKSPEEHKLYTSVTSSFAAGDITAALAGLDEWKVKFPESDYASNRQELYVQAYARSSQPTRAVAAAKPVLAGPFDSADDELRLLYTVVTAVQQIASPPADLLPVAADAARRLMEFDKMPAATKPDDWAKARDSLRTTAGIALLHVTLTPIREAVKSGDCGKAETAGIRAVEQYPHSVQAAWVLASAQLCLARTAPGKLPAALYSLARAAALDPVKGLVDPDWQKTSAAPYFEKVYTQYHGADPEGLRQLKETALKSPLPPDGFTVLSAAQVEQQKQAEFESKNPEVSWLRIRGALAAADGESYFASQLKDAAVPPLIGTLVAAKPTCRPKQLRVAMSQPGPAGAAEVLLTLTKPLAGQPEPNATIRFEGVASAFTREPFLLTMEADPVRVTGLKLRSCSAKPPRDR